LFTSAGNQAQSLPKWQQRNYIIDRNSLKSSNSFFLLSFCFLFEGSILGEILLIGGLYSVLWGKSKESEFASCNDMNRIDGAQDEQEHNKPDANEEAKSEAAGGQV
jgi:hypothetical protein